MAKEEMNVYQKERVMISSIVYERLHILTKSTVAYQTVFMKHVTML